MAKFIVLYKAPVAGLEEWMKMDPALRATEETKMRNEWNTWMKDRGQGVLETAGAGKTKRVTKDGIVDTKNDIMLYSIVEAESHEAAAKIFEGHPHFGIPDGSIEVMAINPVGM